MTEPIKKPPITLTEYELALAALLFHQSKVDHYKAITRQYHYDNESKRIEQRKIDSDKFHMENPNT